MKTLLLLLLGCGFALADPPKAITTLDGRTYSGITSAKPLGNSVRIIHADGAATVLFSQIPEDLRGSLGYDPAAVAAADAAEAKSAKLAPPNVKPVATKASSKELRKQKALAALKDRRFGGASYWAASRDARINQRGSAVNSLVDAGYTIPEAEKITQSLIDAGKSDPRPDPPPGKPAGSVFRQPQGALRNVPASP